MMPAKSILFSNDCLYSGNIYAFPPKKIVSLVPSLTELLYALGLDEEVIGITKFCVHPREWFRTRQRVGGTKTVDIARVASLQPDLIIANKEENVKEQIELLQKIAPVFVTEINTLDDALQAIVHIGKLVDKQKEADELKCKIILAFDDLRPLQQTVNTAYLIWKEPYMAVGGDTFINDMLMRCGFKNIFKDTLRYPELSIADLSFVNNRLSTSSGCQLLLLSSEPYPFQQKHIAELQPQLPGCRILLVDGEMFSWYGIRLLKAVDYFKNLLAQIEE